MPDLRPVALFAATAAFVVWRNSELAVLVDIAYPLNIATRIAAGDVPYRDFPLAQAPLHFLTQAALIRLLGPQFMVQIAYAAIVGGLATVVTWWLARRLLAGAVARPGAVAAGLALALVPLGVTSVYPHPFYDADACLLVLVALAMLFRALDLGGRWRWLAAGVLFTVPIWMKQNIGGAFLAAGVALLAVLLLARGTRPGARWALGGVAAALAVEVAVLELGIGIDHFLRWAWAFAMAGRGVDGERVQAFVDPRLLWPALLLLLPVAAARATTGWPRAAVFLAALALPAVATVIWPDLQLAVPQLFPPILLASVTLATARAAREGPRPESAVPWVVLATTAGAAMSQGIVGSTFAIFPFLVLAMASVVRDVAWAVPAPRLAATGVAAALAALLFAGGTAYTLSNGRLYFAEVDAPGAVTRSTFPTLLGLSSRGPYVRDLDEILEWARANVPAGEGMVFLPGEDPAFYALARRPALPSVYFYDVASPYSAEEIARQADEVGLRWVFVKDRTQLTTEPPRNPAIVRALTQGATLVARTEAFRVYRR